MKLDDRKDKEGHYYYPGGVPVTPQARRIGYEFPVYVSHTVWKKYCRWSGASRHRTNVDKRIVELLNFCYEGMLKRLTQEDDFVFYFFKVWYWPHSAGPNMRKKKRARLGARLFLDPDQDTPWLYIFSPDQDTAGELTAGESPDGTTEDTTGSAAETADPLDFEVAANDRDQAAGKHERDYDGPVERKKTEKGE